MAAVKCLVCIRVTLLVLATVTTFVKAKCDSTGRQCVRSCANRRSGDYQSCDGCHVYVTCSNGVMYDNRPCPASLVWNDKAKVCDWISPTCTCSEPYFGRVVDGQWSVWDPWSLCSATCDGGRQQRVRRCDDPAPHNGGSQCVGVSTQTRPCNQWTCPDCSRTCPPGNALDTDCSQCLCDGDVIEGKVIDKQTSLGVADVNIYTVGREWTPTAVSGRDGTFKMSGVCVSALKITARKDGFESSVQEYAVTNSSVEVVIQKIEKPKFVQEPRSTAGFVRGKASFLCHAIGEPKVTQYDWFKGDRCIFSDKVQGNRTSVLYLNGLTKQNVGHYWCKAVSSGGGILSHIAILVVKESGARDTCNESPISMIVPLPQGCTIPTGLGGWELDSLDIGRCSEVPCVTQIVSDSTSLRCVPSKKEPWMVKCKGFNYPINKILSCECAACKMTKGNVTVVGNVKRPVTTISDVYVLYSNRRYDVKDNQFTFEVQPRAGRIAFQVKSPSFMPQLVSLDIAEGVTEMFLEVILVAKPTSEVVNPATGGDVIVNSPRMSSVVSLTIPPDSFQDKDGNSVAGKVDVFLSYNDPRQPDGLDAAPGQFNYEDEEGETRRLKTYGVVTVVAQDSDGNDVYLRGKTTVKVDVGSLGLTPEEAVFLWSMDTRRGIWKDPVALSFNNANILSGEMEIPMDSPFINIDVPIPRRLICTIVVYVCHSPACFLPIQGETVTALSVENGRIVDRTTSVTDRNGMACLLVFCGLKVIILVKPHGRIIIQATQNLPVGFPFVFRDDGFELIANPAADLKGPIFWDYECPVDPQFYFKVAIPRRRPVLRGSFNPVEEIPGLANSWISSTEPQVDVCVVRMDVLTNDADEMSIVGISSYPDTIFYGTYTSILQNDSNVFAACVMVRCPTNVTRFTAVDLQIASDNRGQCRLRDSYLAEGNVYSRVQYVTHTGGSIQVRVLSKENAMSDPSSDSLPDSGVHTATGTLEVAFNRAMMQCIADSHSVIATYDCTGVEPSTPTV